MYNTMHLYKFLAVFKPELYASAVQLYSINLNSVGFSGFISDLWQIVHLVVEMFHGLLSRHIRYGRCCMRPHAREKKQNLCEIENQFNCKHGTRQRPQILNYLLK